MLLAAAAVLLVMLLLLLLVLLGVYTPPWSGLLRCIHIIV